MIQKHHFRGKWCCWMSRLWFALPRGVGGQKLRPWYPSPTTVPTKNPLDLPGQDLSSLSLCWCSNLPLLSPCEEMDTWTCLDLGTPKQEKFLSTKLMSLTFQLVGGAVRWFSHPVLCWRTVFLWDSITCPCEVLLPWPLNIMAIRQLWMDKSTRKEL